VETPSVSGSEAAVAKLIKEHMDELGFGSSIDAAGNVVGERGAGSPRVLLCGHMDTVPGGPPAKYGDGILTGRGSVDAKGPLAALIMGGALAAEAGFTGSLTVVGVVEEERRNTGIKELIRQGIEADYAVFGEPTNTNTITLGYKGSALIKAEVRTEPGHSSATWLYINAIEKGMELFQAMKRGATSLTEEKEGINALTASIRQIEGGEGCGKIPSLCQIWVEFRLPSGTTTGELVEAVNHSVAEFSRVNDGARVDVEVVEKVEPYVADNRNVLVKAFTRSIYRQTGDKVKLVKKSGTGDMNYYGAETGIPCITYGPGDPHLDHTDDEHIMVGDYLRGIEIIKQALLSLSGLHAKQ